MDDDSDSDNDGGNTTIENLVSESPDTEPDSPLGGSSERSGHPSIDLSKPVDLKSGLEGQERCVAELWLDMLKFYALEYPIEDQIICICTRKNLARSDKNWSKKRVAVVDPFSTKRNLCRSMAQPTVFSYMMLRLKAAVTYFYAPHSSQPTPEHPIPQVSCGVTSDEPSTSNSPEQADSSGLDEVTTSICDIAIHDALDDMATPKYRYEFTEAVVTGGSYPAK
uniref:PAP-associated domain-containing protein n=1 Tax=Ciona savignyi TaxID=51511 RepID=H2Z1E3_CIOSA